MNIHCHISANAPPTAVITGAECADESDDCGVFVRLAPECLTSNSFTSSSDVWAFAVTLWEMFSGGAHPWPGVSGDQVRLSVCVCVCVC